MIDNPMAKADPTPGQTMRLLDHHGEPTSCRVEYDPEWSPSMPYLTFGNGTAGRHFGALKLAQEYLSGHRNSKWSEWK